MRAAGLKAISTVVESTAVLIKSKQPTNPKLVELITSRIRGVISMFSGRASRCETNKLPAAQKYVFCSYNVHRDNLESASKITPGKRAPTINSLEEPGWVAVSAMVEKKMVAKTMDELVTVGAQDILITRLENTRGTA